MKAIAYRITLLEPTLVTALEGDPNSGVAFDYLPGSALRGVVISRYLHDHRLSPSQFDAAETDTRRLFFNGTTRYLNGYPLDRLGNRTLPIPASWQHKKGDKSEIFDFAVECPEDGESQWQNVSFPFCTLMKNGDGDSVQVRLVRPDRHIAVHTARDRQFGRPCSDSGEVFRYDSLAAGQTFEAMILCDHDADTATLLPLLTGEVTLGGSRSGGYGRANLGEAREIASWQETSGMLTVDANQRFIITFLSDALLRDDYGQFSVDPEVVTVALSVWLGVPLNLKQAFLRGQTIGGFNRKWGLPLPQELAVGMGSVFVYNMPACDVNKLCELETQGIGERRVEGFGRVGINWHLEEELAVDTTKPRPIVQTKEVSLGTADEELVKRMTERMLRQRLDERLVAVANHFGVSKPPSNAQIARLRNIIHDELMRKFPNPQRIVEFLNRVRQRNTARRQFDRARVGSIRLGDWLNQTLGKMDKEDWEGLFRFQREDLRKIGEIEPELTAALRAEYVLRLIDAVLARAIKANRKEGE